MICPVSAISGGRAGRENFTKSKIINDYKPKTIINKRVPLTVIPVNSPVVYIPQPIVPHVTSIPYALVMGYIFVKMLSALNPKQS